MFHNRFSGSLASMNPASGRSTKASSKMAYCRQRYTDSGVRFVLCIFNRSFTFCLISLSCFYHKHYKHCWQLLSELIVDFLTHHDLPLKRLLPKCAFTWADTFELGFLWLLIFEVIIPPEYVDAHSIQRLVTTILHHQLLLSWTKTFELRWYNVLPIDDGGLSLLCMRIRFGRQVASFKPKVWSRVAGSTGGSGTHCAWWRSLRPQWYQVPTWW